MKIIRRGKLPQDRTARVTCRECNTTFEVTQGECTLVMPQRGGDDYYKIPCPVCNTICKISPILFKYTDNDGMSDYMGH